MEPRLGQCGWLCIDRDSVDGCIDTIDRNVVASFFWFFFPARRLYGVGGSQVRQTAKCDIHIKNCPISKYFIIIY